MNMKKSVLSRKISRYSKPPLVENSIIFAFIFFGFIGILHHEMWRDEFQAWLLARDSASLIELFQNMRYEGHPALWHLFLYGLTHITHNPLIMQIFHLLISVVIIFLIVKKSPFSLLHRFLLSFGYLIFYEYTMISRNYNLGILFIFLFCTFYSSQKVKSVLLAIILALMANTNAYGFMISFALSLALIYDIFVKIKANKYQPQKIATTLIILFLGWAISLAQIIRPLLVTDTIIRPLESASSQIKSNPSLLQEVKKLGNAIANIWKSYVPIPLDFKARFWDSNILIHNPHIPSISTVSLAEILAVLASFLLLCLAIKFLSKQPLILIIYVTGTFSLIAFQYLIFSGSMRHWGNLFILFIACFWLLQKELLQEPNSSQTQRDENKFKSQFLTVIFSIQLLAGFHAYSIDMFYPFSMGKEVANYIKENQLEKMTILGQSMRMLVTIPGYLDQKIYYPETEEFGSFWTKKTKKKNSEELLKDIEKLIRQTNNDVLLITSYRLKYTSLFSPYIKITESKTFRKPSIAPNENFYRLYIIQEVKPILNKPNKS